jgi:2-oxoglutarate ferredoxin oxidoreductase subunit alpha
MRRLRIKIVGESGSGLLTTGEIILAALKSMGVFLHADREYPSLIKGGASCFTINVSDEPIFSLSEMADVMLVIDKPSLLAYNDKLKDGGVLIHGYDRVKGIADILAKLGERDVKIVSTEARELAFSVGGNALMVNVLLVGMLWQVLGLSYERLEAVVREKFASKPKLVELNLKCLKVGFEATQAHFDLPIRGNVADPKMLLIDGNKAVALGAVAAGVRAYYAYPMSPSSSILTYLKDFAVKTGMHVQQVEDEISVVQMALGSMYAGTRALCATSGGGFDLMTESVSLAGIVEVPLVIVIAQRPGPGTGLPTWTMQGDLNLAIYAGHGEFARIVLAVADAETAFALTKDALNLAEKFQVPVLLLTEKVIAESQFMAERFVDGPKEKLDRGLVLGSAEMADLKREDRYEITESGVSKRWLPGSSAAYYFANGDEHLPDGSLTEDADMAGAMYAKRVRKLNLIAKELPEPLVYGDPVAKVSFVGFGSTLNTMRDVIGELADQGVSVNYLHFEYLYPLKTNSEVVRQFLAKNPKIHLLEGNYTGQFGQIFEQGYGVSFAGKLLKYNGRPFFLEDVLDYIKNILN